MISRMSGRALRGCRERSGSEGAIEREVGLRHRVEVAVDQRAEDRFLVREVVIDVALGESRLLGDVRTLVAP